MTKIVTHDVYLNKDVVFYVNKNIDNEKEADKLLNITSRYFFTVRAAKPANRIEQVLIPILCKSSTDINDVLFFHVKYLIIK